MTKTFLNTLCALALAGATLAAAGAAHATPVTYAWTSTVVNDVLTLGIHAGDKITGTLTYDGADAVAFYGGTDGGRGRYMSYETPSMKTSFKIGSVQETASLHTTVFNDTMFNADQIRLGGSSASYADIDFVFTDGAMRALSSVDIPATLNLSAFTSTMLNFYTDRDMIFTTFDKFEAATGDGASGDVPEPASLALFGVALASLSVARRKRMR